MPVEKQISPLRSEMTKRHVEPGHIASPFASNYMSIRPSRFLCGFNQKQGKHFSSKVARMRTLPVFLLLVCSGAVLGQATQSKSQTNPDDAVALRELAEIKRTCIRR